MNYITYDLPGDSGTTKNRRSWNADWIVRLESWDDIPRPKTLPGGTPYLPDTQTYLKITVAVAPPSLGTFKQPRFNEFELHNDEARRFMAAFDKLNKPRHRGAC